MSIIDMKKDLSALFTAQVDRTPDAAALADPYVVYSYIELDRKVDALAKELRTHGVGRDSLVGVFLGRSADYVIACLASLRAGGAFLVLELAYPPDLLADVLRDARPAVVITCKAELSRVKEGVPLIVLDDTERKDGGIAPSPLPANDDLDRLSFVSYSSGTTGKPKGIANPHRAPVLSYNLRFGLSDLGPGDRVACNVFFVWEILRPLLRGAMVYAVPDEVSYDPAALIELLAAEKVTETLMTPTLLAAVLAQCSDLSERLPNLRTLWLNGEVVTTDLARRAIKALPKARLLNCYSACETHEIACGDIRQMLDESSHICPTGHPMEADNVYILDDNQQRKSIGEIGELYVGGDLLARGYLNRPDAEAKAFLANPFKQGGRIYRTGDLARLLPSGALEVTGRTGTMIKLRGYSVVPGKVQDTIVRYLNVRDCIVTSHGDGLDRQLVAYFVPEKGSATGRAAVEITELGHSSSARRELSPYLAQYMIPMIWIELTEIPTHGVSGKIDLKRLPLPKSFRLESSSDPTGTTPSIDSMSKVWAEVLKVPQKIITPDQSFFDLGGHSLLLASLASTYAKRFNVQIPLGRLADPATLQGHLGTIVAVRSGQNGAQPEALLELLTKDIRLDFEEGVERFNRGFFPITAAETIFLTGATGFLGGFLLNELLEQTQARILCLVRAKGSAKNQRANAVARLRKSLLELGLWRDDMMSRVKVVPGDLSKPQLGLSDEDLDDVLSRAQIAVHAGAIVNLVYPYAALRDANVGGTRELLRLADEGGISVVHISTNGVLPPAADAWPESTVIALKEVPTVLPDGYGQTKWVAERLAFEAGKQHVPVQVIRLGTISGHSRTGVTNSSDLLSALTVESINLGYAPHVSGWRAEMTPVDTVCKSIIQLADQGAVEEPIFHVGDPKPVDMKVVFDELAQLGYPTERVGWNEWVKLWNEKRGSSLSDDEGATSDVLSNGMPAEDFLKSVALLGDIATRPHLEEVQRPKIDRALLEAYTRHWHARGWLATGPSGKTSIRPQGSLSGRVAVITGASSGIGAAVALALAKEGASVALGARRVEALEGLKAQIEALGGQAIAVKTDVTDRKQVEALVKAASDGLGPVDILVACAGVMYWTMMANVRVEEWEQTVDVNCKGLLHCLSSTVPSMIARGSGHVVAISSDAGRKVFPGLGVYSASKFFVEATLQSLRLETAGSGLRVTSVQPGNVATDLLGLSKDEEAIEKYAQPSGAKILDPENVANAIVYALKQPAHVAVNEILIEPQGEPI